ncbi:MAG: Hsp20 family protein [Rhodoblastus sp.]|nr:MAG: Hsp20 family protein [Rhodoblastus sp.]
MSRTTLLNSPFLLGFDEVEKALERAARAGAGEGYPPYNVERLAADEGWAERIRISLAVAGFCAEQLEIAQEENQLTIRGRQVEEASERAREFLHRGIAARQFQRSFLLGEGMEVLGASLERGILSIDLSRPEPKRVTRRIAIATRD